MKFLEAGYRLAFVHPTPFNILGHPGVLQSDLRRHELLDDSLTREIVRQGTEVKFIVPGMESFVALFSN